MQDRQPIEPSSDDLSLLRMSVTSGCTEEQIKAAYRQRARELHPDHGGDAEQFRQLQREYEAALERLRRPDVTPVAVHSYVPQSPVKRRARKRPFRRVALLLLLFGTMAFVLPAGGRMMALLLLPAAAGLILMPVIVSTWKPHISGLLFLVTTPIWIVIMVAVRLNDRFGRAMFAPDTAEFGDYVLLALFVSAAAFWLSIFLGMLFSFANSR